MLQYYQVDEVKSVYREIRGSVDDHFSRLYQHAVRLAKEVDEHMILSRPRIGGRQQHRANAPAESSEESYRRNIAIPFLDHIIQELDEQFSGTFSYKHTVVYFNTIQSYY